MLKIFGYHDGDLQGAVGVVRQSDVPVPPTVVSGPHVLERGEHDVVGEKILEQVLEKNENLNFKSNNSSK